jgi:signal transduction histidine kinase/ActR/RegA family two-component response regulator
MKKYIVISFALVFILFGVGSAVTIYHLLNTTSNLRYLINLHEIEDIRQSLSFSLQRIQSYTFSSSEYFAKHLDEIIDNANKVNEKVEHCHSCHHGPDIEAELTGVETLIQEYQEQLSYLMTMSTEGERRRNLQLRVMAQSNVILNLVQGMASRAANTLNLKTSLAMRKIDESYKILAATLLLTFLAAMIAAQYLAHRIKKPLDELRSAAIRIAEGELGQQTKFKGHKEFTELINTFNNMSASLAAKEDTIKSTMQKLKQLSLSTLPLHKAHDINTIFSNLRSSINGLIVVEHIGILLPEENDEVFILHLFAAAADKTDSDTIPLPWADIQHVYKEAGGQPIQHNGPQDGVEWPFTDKPQGIRPEKFLLAWMLLNNNVNGALIVINKQDTDFNEEDLIILAILANNISVALDNIKLIKDAKQHMQELKKTQRQLVEAEKLTALGTLAGGVAHDFNNILCGMIGYVALLKRNHDPEDKDFKMLDTIEKAGFRAARLTKQLLTFSRQEILDHRPIDVNLHIENVVKLLENTISKIISIRLELGESLPPVLSDPAQLEHVIMNLSINARDAMPNGGQILIQSDQANVDQQFCEEQPQARPGNYIRITVSDQGEGIDRDILPRIFEPFFTTREFGKGTGLGLAMAHGIVKSHKGFIHVSSTPGKGTSFSVYLPVARLEEDSEVQPETSEQMLRANILIVDDEELVAFMLAQHLQNLGCRTFNASNGEEALDILEKHKHELDVAILDLNMPVMDGRETYEKMVELKPDIKVLISSGFTRNGSVEELLAKGAHGFIEKPFSLENITAKIKEVLTES